MSDDATDATQNSTDPLEDLIALYALGALDADDRARVERGLANDARLRALFDDVRETVGQLHADAQPVDAPAWVKQRVFARVDAETFSRSAPGRPQTASLWTRIKRVLLAASPVAAATAIVLALGLGAWASSLQQQLAQARLQFSQTQQELAVAQQQLSQAQPELAQARQQLSQVQQELTQTQQRLAQAQLELAQTQQDLAQAREELAQAQEQITQSLQVLALLQQPGLQLVSLPRAENAPASAQFNFFASPSNSSALLSVSGLKPLPSNQTYEFWLLRDGQPVPAGTFNVDEDGAGKLIVQAADSLSTFDQAGITIEPAGGSAAPTLSALVSIGSIR